MIYKSPNREMGENFAEAYIEAFNGAHDVLSPYMENDETARDHSHLIAMEVVRTHGLLAMRMFEQAMEEEKR